MNTEYNNNQKVALMVGRFQPLHLAHCIVIEHMLKENDVVIVGIGSAQAYGTDKNPYNAQTRTQMLRNVFGDKIHIIELNDLGTDPNTSDWIMYVIDKCKVQGIPTPNRYYSGCLKDAIWYRTYFTGSNPSKETNDHLVTFTHESENRQMIIYERTLNHYLPATKIREYLAMGLDEWKRWVSPENWQIIKDSYPASL